MPTHRVALALACLAVALANGRPALAHPPAIVNGPTEKVMAEEVADFRKRMAEAIRNKDATALHRMYADSFRHTHGTGTIDGKPARLATALAGHAMIETEPVQDLQITVPNGWAAIVTGKSSLRTPKDGKITSYRWIMVYVRVGESWQVAASQQTRIDAAN